MSPSGISIYGPQNGDIFFKSCFEPSQDLGLFRLSVLGAFYFSKVLGQGDWIFVSRGRV